MILKSSLGLAKECGKKLGGVMCQYKNATLQNFFPQLYDDDDSARNNYIAFALGVHCQFRLL
jgi:hypothetical protein